MATVAQSIRVESELVDVYDRLAEATGRPRNQLFVEALRTYAATEGWQIREVRATLAALEDGTMDIIPGEQVVGELIARGRLSHEALDAACARYGVPVERAVS